ncbi:MAG: signal peptidase I [Planctomycetaceae bacterium]|jgi:signal peptidase I|nr:signal peptidase I [Planctomycetaceae bacterium]
MEEQKLYRHKWIGVLCTIILPGSAHFLAGQRRWGILLFCGYAILGFLRWFITSIPGQLFDVLTPFLFFAPTMYIILLLVFSWHPIHRLRYRGWILFILFALIFRICVLESFVIFHFSRNVAEFSYTTYSTMSPTIVPSAGSSWLEADVIVSNAWIYYWNTPKRGDIVRFYYYDKDGKADPKLWARRIVGLPGETIDIDPPYILINGKRLVEPDIFKKISESQDGYTGYCFSKSNNRIALPVTLGNDEYFLLGDNSEKSVDSRMFGSVRRSNIKAKVIRIVFPPSRIKEL